MNKKFEVLRDYHKSSTDRVSRSRTPTLGSLLVMALT